MFLLHRLSHFAPGRFAVVVAALLTLTGLVSCADDSEEPQGSCVDDGDCDGDRICDDGFCTSDTDGGCKADESRCDDKCVDLETSTQHCQQCENECTATAVDAEPICTESGCAEQCLDSEAVICDDACRNIERDARHCGDCDHRCEPDEMCVDGQCEQLDLVVETFDTIDDVLSPPSIAVDKRRNLHISYLATDRQIRYARFDGDEWTIDTVYEDSGYRRPAIALTSDEEPRIAFVQTKTRDVLYAIPDDDEWHIQTAYSGRKADPPWSLVLDEHDHPHMVIKEYTERDVFYIWYRDGGWHSRFVDSVGDQSFALPSGAKVLDLDRDGMPHISYGQPMEGRQLIYARPTNGEWGRTEVERLDWFFSSNDLALDGDDTPHISFSQIQYGPGGEHPTRDTLRYATIENGDWHVETVDEGVDAEDTGYFSSLAVDNSENPHISYISLRGKLRYARENHTRWQLRTLFDIDTWSESLIITSPAMVLGPADQPHIVYRLPEDHRLHYATFGVQ